MQEDAPGAGLGVEQGQPVTGLRIVHGTACLDECIAGCRRHDELRQLGGLKPRALELPVGQPPRTQFLRRPHLGHQDAGCPRRDRRRPAPYGDHRIGLRLPECVRHFLHRGKGAVRAHCRRFAHQHAPERCAQEIHHAGGAHRAPAHDEGPPASLASEFARKRGKTLLSTEEAQFRLYMLERKIGRVLVHGRCALREVEDGRRGRRCHGRARPCPRPRPRAPGA